MLHPPASQVPTNLSPQSCHGFNPDFSLMSNATCRTGQSQSLFAGEAHGPTIQKTLFARQYRRRPSRGGRIYRSDQWCCPGPPPPDRIRRSTSGTGTSRCGGGRHTFLARRYGPGRWSERRPDPGEGRGERSAHRPPHHKARTICAEGWENCSASSSRTLPSNGLLPAARSAPVSSSMHRALC